MKQPFVLTPAAKADLENILLDVALDSPETSERLRIEFHHAFRRLPRTPGIGRYREELLDRRYRFSNLYSYVVVYLWSRNPLSLIAVIHGRRDLAAYFGVRTV